MEESRLEMLFQNLGFGLVYVVIALLVALSFHEASHAFVANLLGDDTAKRMGRLSLNPLAHLDPLGSLMILFIGIGWGKPVQIDADKLRPGPKIGMALVAIAGPITNILLALFLGLPLRFHLLTFTSQRIFSLSGRNIDFSPGFLFQTMVTLSLALALFNLIPISPLDGSRLWQIVLPMRWYYVFARYEIIGVFVVIGLVLADLYLHIGILNQVICPPVDFLWQPFVGFGHPVGCGG
jgi:Zn-dependent protease